jgi:hypothetical protein
MKNQRLKLTAIKAFLFAGLLGFATLSWAQVVGTIAHLSGPLVAKKPNGTVKVLAVKSEVENGDTLVAEKNTYAQIKFVDNGEITLRPNTVFKIEKFAYDAGKPEGDAANFDLVKGGLRSVTGLLGKRNKEKFALKTPSATIGIRGTTFIAQYVPPPPPAGGNGMTINHNPSPLEGYNPGKLANPGSGTGTIDRSPDNGGANMPGAGKVPASGSGTPPGGNGIPINPNPSVLDSYNPGKLANPGGGTGTINRSPDGGAPTSGSGILPVSGQSPATPPNSGGGSTGPVGLGLAGGPPLTPPLTPPNGGGGSLGPVGVGQAGPPPLAPGLHLQVTDGAIIVTNNGGSLGFQAGQFGFVPSVNQPPVIVPPNTGIQFVPPPAFNGGSGGPTASTGSGAGQATDCIVR